MDGAIGLIFNNQGKLLLVKRRDVPVWVFPGGGIEKGETPEEAVVREVLEESGYKVKIIKKVAEYKYKDSGKKNYVFKCKIQSGRLKTGPESKEVSFYYLKSLPNPRHPFIDLCLKDTLSSTCLVKKELSPIKTKDVVKQIFKYPIPVLRYLLFKLGLRINT